MMVLMYVNTSLLNPNNRMKMFSCTLVRENILHFLIRVETKDVILWQSSVKMHGLASYSVDQKFTSNVKMQKLDVLFDLCPSSFKKWLYFLILT